MKELLLIALFFCGTNNLLSNSSKKSDLDYYNKKITELDSSYKELQTKHIQIRDSLNQEIKRFVAREDYLSVSLEDQASRFTLIITGLLALAALGGYATYKIELRRIKKHVNSKISNQQKEFDNYKERIEKIDGNLRTSVANTFASVAYTYRKERFYTTAFDFCMRAARNHGIAYLTHFERLKKMESPKQSDKLEDDILVIITSLELAIEDFENFNSLDNPEHYNEINGIKDEIFDCLNELQSIDNSDISLLLARIRVSLYEYISKEK